VPTEHTTSLYRVRFKKNYNWRASERSEQDTISGEEIVYVYIYVYGRMYVKHNSSTGTYRTIDNTLTGLSL